MLSQPREQLEVALRCEQMDHVGQDDRVVPLGQRVFEEISRRDLDVAPHGLARQALPRHRGRGGQLEERGLELRIPAQYGDQKRPGAPAHVEQPPVPTEVVPRRECLGMPGAEGFHAFGEDFLFALGEFELSKDLLVCADGLFELQPARIGEVAREA
jgi:hypothetical protein